MHLHNFIVDFCEGGGQSVLESIALDWSVFDKECHQFLATNLEQDPEGGKDGGVYGGKQNIRHDDNFDQYQGERPKVDKADSKVVGRQWRDNIQDEITRRRLICPSTNSYLSNDCMYNK
jgi:hypothetical protein